MALEALQRNGHNLCLGEFSLVGSYDVPKLMSTNLNNRIQWIPFNCVMSDRQREHHGVHFFIDDYRFQGVYSYPQRSLNRLSRFKFVMTPDYSLYAEMPRWLQLKNVAQNRWCGAYWQSMGLCVIPTVTWADEDSFSFCFDGIAKHSSVAISTVGCRNAKSPFLKGYDKMLEVIEPEMIICYGTPFDEMTGNIVCYPYEAFRKKVS